MGAGMLALFGGIVFLASFVQGVSGFAFGMIVLIVLPYLFSYTTALALTSMMTVVLLLYNSFLYRKYCAWKWIPLGLAAFAGGDICGVLVLRAVGDAPVWYILMGIMLIFMAAYLWWGQKRVTFTATNRNWVIFACTSGFVVGAFIVGLPILATFFLQATKSKEEYLGTMQMFSLFTVGFDTIVRVANGMVTAEVLTFTAISLVFIIAGLLVAHYLVQKMNADMLRKVVCVVMAVNGVIMFFHQ